MQKVRRLGRMGGKLHSGRCRGKRGWAHGRFESWQFLGGNTGFTRRRIWGRGLEMERPEESKALGRQESRRGEPVDRGGRFQSTLILKGSASEREYGNALSESMQHGVVVDRCPSCLALLDVSACMPLVWSGCPICGADFQVMRAFHHFEMRERLAVGGMGAVYLAFDRSLSREVAVKVLSADCKRLAGYLERLEQEAQMTALVTHPNVVQVFSAGMHNGLYYVAMELIRLGTVAKFLEGPFRLSEAEVLGFAEQAALGLQAAYQRGLLHRDVKPANLMLGDEKTVKVVDFGLAKPVRDAARVSGEEDVLGTPFYVAPEKVLRRGEDVRSDIYSLGATIYHVLAGVPVFDCESVLEIMQAHVSTPAPSVLTRNHGVSLSTARMIARMLQKDPELRQGDYLELLVDIRVARMRLEEGNAAAQIHSSLQGKLQAEENRSRSVQGLLYLAGLVVLVIALSGLVFFRPTVPKEYEPPPPQLREQVQSSGPVQPFRALPVETLFGPAKGRVLFEDTFRDGMFQWGSAPGALRGQEGVVLRSVDALLTREGSDWAEYVFESEILVRRGGVGVFFAFRDPDNYCLYDLGMNGDVKFWRCTHGVVRNLPVSNAAGGGAVGPGWAMVSLVLDQGGVQLKVNGTLCDERRESGSLQGRVGFRTRGIQEALVRFVRVSQP
jgi:serine/threonine protein kinase